MAIPPAEAGGVDAPIAPAFPRTTPVSGAGTGALTIAAGKAVAGRTFVNPGCRSPSKDSRIVSRMIRLAPQLLSSVLRTRPPGTASLLHVLVTIVQFPFGK